MFDGSTHVTPAFLPALKAFGLVGTWETHVPAGRSVLDAGAATLMAGDAALAGQSISLEVALSRIHPEDRGWVFERIRLARRTGGPFAAEFRVIGAGGSVRWILNRGRLPDPDGGTHGYGAYIDTTESRAASKVVSLAERRAFRAPDPLETAVDHALATRAAIERTDHPGLRGLVDMLLLEMGRALVRRRQP